MSHILLSCAGAIFAVRSAGRAELSELALLGREISLCYAEAANQLLAECRSSSITVEAIAAHGQTLYHAPPYTIQWLDPALLAAETGCRSRQRFPPRRLRRRRAGSAAGAVR